MNTCTYFTGAITLAISLASLNSHASFQAEQPDVVRVPYTMEDLSDTEAREKFYQRLNRAAESACGSPHIREPGSLHQSRNTKVCVEKALDRAIEKINNASISAIHLG